MYCTIADLTDRYGLALLIELSFRGETRPDQPDVALFDRAIADAAALIDGHLKPRYALPLAEVPPLLRDLAIGIAIYKAHARVADEKIRMDYQDALKVLAQIAAGTVRLDIEGAEPAAPEDGGVVVSELHRPITVETMKGYI